MNNTPQRLYSCLEGLSFDVQFNTSLLRIMLSLISLHFKSNVL
ncbi:hypothetical protein AsAng_0049050 [Aureispira anguillae]|uniref:Uncharacterized protein n=1 Tax=Aureispira anguillae TaxID=2864201 RepID=A0A915YJT8_9BACT|nr:hypothetical protein AsAng_0049050 [Aureispira anguillae]